MSYILMSAAARHGPRLEGGRAGGAFTEQTVLIKASGLGGGGGRSHVLTALTSWREIQN